MDTKTRQENKKKNCAQIKKILKSLKGSLKDVPEFKGMNGVDLQHYIYKNLW